MIRLSSPDATIQTLLDTHARLHTDLQAYIDTNGFKTARILPGFWTKFLESAYGVRWKTPEPDDIPEPVVPTPPPHTCYNGLCRNLAFCKDCSMCAVHCGCAVHDMQPVAQPQAQPQDDLFDLLARGLKDRIQPQGGALDEARVREMIDVAIESRRNASRYMITLKAEDSKWTHHIPTDLPLPRWFDRVYKQALCRVHTLLVGPRGCGKTMTAELLAKALDLPLYTVSLSAGVSEGVLQGWLHPSKAGLLFEYNRSRFVKAYQEGGVCLLDELDAADSNMLMILNAALANGTWEIPLRGEEAEPLTKHPDFICIAAANTQLHGADREYVARNQLDKATIDRFMIGRITVDYDEDLERQAFDKATVTFGHRLRARCRAQKGWTRDVSTRNIADACKLQSQLTLEESWFGFFEDWNDADCEKVGAVRKRDSMSVTLE